MELVGVARFLQLDLVNLRCFKLFFNQNTATSWDFARLDPDFPTYGGGGAIYQEFADTLKLQTQLYHK